MTPPHMQLQLLYTNYTTPQLQLQYATTTTTTALRHTTCSSCGWGDRPGDHWNHCNHSKTQLQTPFSPSMDSLCHPWLTSPIGFLFLKLPPPPCAALLVYNCVYNYLYIYVYIHDTVPGPGTKGVYIQRRKVSVFATCYPGYIRCRASCLKQRTDTCTQVFMPDCYRKGPYWNKKK